MKMSTKTKTKLKTKVKMMSNILLDIIKSNSSCVIIPHKSPDGDCLGSSLTLANFFSKNNCKVNVLLDEEIPTNYKFLNIPFVTTSDIILSTNTKYDYAVVVDTSDKARIGANLEVLELCSNLVVFDHHKTNNYYGDFNVVEMLSSVGELLYKNYIEIGYEIDLIDAKGLYTSIITDTGNLKYSNTTSATLKQVASLFDTGFDFEAVNRNIYGNQELVKVKLRSEVLSNMEIHNEGKIAILQVTQNLLDKTSAKMFHSDGIVEAGRDIAGVEVSVLLKEVDDNTVKVSMRSKEYLDVAEISLLYKGGGHVRAAGCTILKPLEETKSIILDILTERL